jgi:ketosteroid isomerase-like protein
MSRENVEVMRQIAEAINRGDAEAVVRLVHEDVVLKALRSAVEGDYRGHDGVRRFFADNAENFEIFTTDYREVRDLGDRVLGIGTIHIRGKGSGVETDIPTAGVATFREGKLARWEDYGDRRVALEAAGLLE